MDARLDAVLDGGVAGVAVPRQPVEGLDDELADRRNSPTPKPREVPAGVPRRMPEVTIGFSGSKGTPFLLQVMWARPERRLGGLAGQPFGRRSTSIRWLSVPPATMA